MWEADHPHYKFRKPKWEEPDYKSFFVAPLVDRDGVTHGVLCLDSPNPDKFDDEDVVTSIKDISESLASAVAIYKNLIACVQTSGTPTNTAVGDKVQHVAVVGGNVRVSPARRRTMPSSNSKDGTGISN